MLLRIALVMCTMTILLSLSTSHCHSMPEPEQLKVGNFALPRSQQPNTLYGFGQYVLDQGDLLGACATESEIGHNNNNCNTLFPYLIYGARDDIFLVFTIPIAAQCNQGCESSSGLLDAVMEIEYLAYEYKTERSRWEVSLEGGLFLPFGNKHKEPKLSFGSPAFFAGIITRYIATDWYWYVSTGGTFTTSHNKTKAGNEFLYQTGFGKNVGYESEKWLCTVMLEMNGICMQKEKHCGILDPNTGGNMVALGPTIWFSTQRFIFQAGILPIVYQHWNGDQTKKILFINFNFEWKFT